MDTKLLIYGIALALTVLVLIAFYLLLSAYLNQESNESYEDQLQAIIGAATPGEEVPSGGKRPRSWSGISRWNRYWTTTFTDLGWISAQEEEGTVGRLMLLGSILTALAISGITHSFIFGVVLTVLVLYGGSLFIRTRNNRRIEKLNQQLPAFLFSLKGNVQANVTPENAILNVVDELDSPLYDDMVIVKQRIQANSTFSDALRELHQRTASPDLKFLCSCLLQAMATGTNMEKQLTTIQEKLTTKRRRSQKLATAVKEATPVLWVATIIIPAFFIFTMSTSPSAQAFWFKDPISWAIFFIIIGLYGVCLALSKRLVDNIKNL